MFQTITVHRLLRATFLAATLITPSDAVCYLEGTDCSVCWKTINSVTTMAACPAGIKMEVIKALPREIVSQVDYATEYKLVIDETQFPISANGGKDIPHANVHSCLRHLGACTPFVSNTPGLATHTQAMSVVQVAQDGSGISSIPFTSQVNLEANKYTVIYHGRFFTTESAGLAKYDVAIGFPVDVVPGEKEVPASAIFTALISVGAVVMVTVTLILLWKLGCLDFEGWMELFYHPNVVGFMLLTLNITDVASFSVSFFTQIKNDNDIVSIQPFCYITLVFGILLSLVSSVLYVKTRCMAHPHESLSPEELLRTQSAAYLDLVRHTKRKKSKGLETLPESLLDEAIRRFSKRFKDAQPHLEELEKLVRDGHAEVITNILCILFEDIPIIAIEMWVMINASTKTVFATPLALVSASIVFGVKLCKLGGWKLSQLRKKKLRILLEEIYESAAPGA